jgi:hypothetical protein
VNTPTLLAAIGLAALLATTAATAQAGDAPATKLEDAGLMAVVGMCALGPWICSPGWKERLAVCAAQGIGCSTWRDGPPPPPPRPPAPQLPAATQDAVTIVRGR